MPVADWDPYLKDSIFGKISNLRGSLDERHHARLQIRDDLRRAISECKRANRSNVLKERVSLLELILIILRRDEGELVSNVSLVDSVFFLNSNKLTVWLRAFDLLPRSGTSAERNGSFVDCLIRSPIEIWNPMGGTYLSKSELQVNEKGIEKDTESEWALES